MWGMEQNPYGFDWSSGQGEIVTSRLTLLDEIDGQGKSAADRAGGALTATFQI